MARSEQIRSLILIYQEVLDRGAKIDGHMTPDGLFAISLTRSRLARGNKTCQQPLHVYLVPEGVESPWKIGLRRGR